MAGIGSLIRNDQPLETGATAVYPYSPSLELKYRFTSRFGDDVELFKRDGNIIHLPRALCPVGQYDNRDEGEHVVFPKGPKPRDYQVEVFKQVADLCKQGLSGVVVAQTGWGKTVLGLHAAYIMQRKTLVITTKEDIYDKWREGAEQFLGLKKHEIGEIRGDKCEVIGTKFCVALIQSMSKDGKYPDWVTKGFGLVIFDETHRVAANQFSAVADLFPAKMRLGLSATIKRSDGKELLVHAHIGPVRATATVEMMVPRVMRFASPWTCPYVTKKDPATGLPVAKRLPHQAGKTAHVEKIMAKNDARNKLICDLIETAFGAGRKTVIFFTLLDHIERIEKRLVFEHGINISRIGKYVGEITKAGKMLREQEQDRPILLTTYNMMSEGTDLPWLDTCLLAMPRSNITQPVGRIRRLFKGKKDPLVMDIVDSTSPVFNSYAETRLRWYNSIGATVLER